MIAIGYASTLEPPSNATPQRQRIDRPRKPEPAPQFVFKQSHGPSVKLPGQVQWAQDRCQSPLLSESDVVCYSHNNRDQV